MAVCEGGLSSSSLPWTLVLQGSGSQFRQGLHPAIEGDVLVAVQLTHAQHTAQHRQCLVLLQLNRVTVLDTDDNLPAHEAACAR